MTHLSHKSKTVLMMLLSVLILALTAGAALAAADDEVAGRAFQPQIPVVVDGVLTSPDALNQFDGRSLYYVATEEDVAKGHIVGFTNESDAQAYMAAHDANNPAGMLLGIGKVKVYDLTGYSDLFAKFSRGDRESDLATAPCFCDNDISSTKTNGKWLTLYPLTNFDNSLGWLAVKGSHPDLGIYGYNNIASSLEVD